MNWDKIKINKDKFRVTFPNGMSYTFKTLKNALIFAAEQKRLYYYEGWYFDIERISQFRLEALANFRRQLSHAESEKVTALFMFKRTGKPYFEQQYLALVKTTDRLLAIIEDFTRGDD